MMLRKLYVNFDSIAYHLGGVTGIVTTHMEGEDELGKGENENVEFYYKTQKFLFSSQLTPRLKSRTPDYFDELNYNELTTGRANQPIHWFLVGQLQPYQQGTHVRVV